MIPAHARVLVCPHCGGTKEILSLVSGNTFGALHWSDNKTMAPMLPRPSEVQRCPECGHFYLLSQVKEEREGEDYSFNKGELAWEEMKLALKEAESWKMKKPDILDLGFTALWSFNDEFYREEETESEPTAEDLELHYRNLDNLIKVVDDKLMKAELYRERGDYESAQEHLNKVAVPANPYLGTIVEGIQERILEKDPRPFFIDCLD